jgi:hypothetical protein
LITLLCGILFIGSNSSYFYFGIVICSRSIAAGALQIPFLNIIIGVKACLFSFRDIEETLTLSLNEWNPKVIVIFLLMSFLDLLIGIRKISSISDSSELLNSLNWDNDSILRGDIWNFGGRESNRKNSTDNEIAEACSFK